MNYRNLLFCAFALAISMLSYSESKQARIQRLKDAEYQKEFEISNLCETISHKYTLLQDYKLNALQYWTAVQKKKIEDLQKKNLLSKEEAIKAQSEIKIRFIQFIEELSNKFETAHDFKPMIEQETCDQDSFEIEEDSFVQNPFELLQITSFRFILERRLIGKLIGKYNTCIQDLFNLNAELISLKR